MIWFKCDRRRFRFQIKDQRARLGQNDGTLDHILAVRARSWPNRDVGALST